MNSLNNLSTTNSIKTCAKHLIIDLRANKFTMCEPQSIIACVCSRRYDQRMVGTIQERLLWTTPGLQMHTTPVYEILSAY